MKINYECLPCLVNQTIKVADMTGAENKEILFKKVFAYLSEVDFTKTNPEIIGSTYRMIKNHIKHDDPYHDTRAYYNKLFLGMLNEFEDRITRSPSPFHEAVKLAIIGNIIDFNPMHNSTIEDILNWFSKLDDLSLTVDHTNRLIGDLKSANSLLYIGDNCGEICLDKLLLKQIKTLNPSIHIYFGVRGTSIVNDSVFEDAKLVGIDEYATIVSNGDDSLGTVLSRTSDTFNKVYKGADVIISKGQANYESLSEQADKNIYYMLMTKCNVIARYIGVPQKSLICINGCTA